MADKQGKTRTQFEAEIVARAWKDADFKKRLIKDPKSVIQEAVTKMGGKKLPDDLKVTVLEESGKNIYLVLPPNPQTQKTDVLTDEQLEAAAGGAVAIGVINAIA
jgi:hypothetical protein